MKALDPQGQPNARPALLERIPPQQARRISNTPQHSAKSFSLYRGPIWTLG
jgi:hypothetical protein